jgi:hypothetical protein
LGGHALVRAQSKDSVWDVRHPLIDVVSRNAAAAAARHSPIIIWGKEKEVYYWYLLTT